MHFPLLKHIAKIGSPFFIGCLSSLKKAAFYELHEEKLPGVLTEVSKITCPDYVAYISIIDDCTNISEPNQQPWPKRLCMAWAPSFPSCCQLQRFI